MEAFQAYLAVIFGTLGAALCGDRYTAFTIAAVFFASMIVYFNQPKHY